MRTARPRRVSRSSASSLVWRSWASPPPRWVRPFQSRPTGWHRRTRAEPLLPARVLACVAAAISGCAALIYEVSWTRLLALVIGPTTYAFATMAAAFISGLAIGSAIGARIARRVSRPAVWLAAMLVISSVAASGAAWYAAARLPLRVAAEVADPAAAFGPVVAAQAVLVGLLLLPMTLALGATFPLALAAAGPGVSAGRAAAVVAVASVAAVVSLPPWDPQLLSSGAYKYAPYIGAADLDFGLRAGTLEFYKEGAAATVSVRRLAGVRALSIDGKVDASNGGDMLTQRLLGLLPVLMHEQPTDVCVIGLGSGVTLESALATGTVVAADVVEISPEVVEA